MYFFQYEDVFEVIGLNWKMLFGSNRVELEDDIGEEGWIVLLIFYYVEIFLIFWNVQFLCDVFQLQQVWCVNLVLGCNVFCNILLIFLFIYVGDRIVNNVDEIVVQIEKERKKQLDFLSKFFFEDKDVGLGFFFLDLDVF